MHILKGKINMTLLRLHNNGKKTEAQFLDLSEKKDDPNLEQYYKNVELIEGSDVKDIFIYIMKNDDASLDAYDEDALDNPAQKLIYKELYNEISKVINSRNDILTKINDEFKSLESKYDSNVAPDN